MAYRELSAVQFPLKAVIGFLIIVSINLSYRASIAYAQNSKRDAVDIIKTEGKLVDITAKGYKMEITGTIRNTLPIDVVNVQVAVTFPGIKTARLNMTSLPKIPAQQSKRFSIVAQLSQVVTRFSVHIEKYYLGADDVDQILTYFWNNEGDSALREAAMATLEKLSTRNMSKLVARFQASHAEEDQVKALIEDLILLPLLSKSQHPDEVVQALLDKAPIYSDPLYQITFLRIKAWVEKGPTVIPLLNQAAQTNQTLIDLLQEPLAAFGNRALPILIQNSLSPHVPQAQLAAHVLKQLDQDTPDKQIAALLALASADDRQRQAVLRILNQWGSESYRLVGKAIVEATDGAIQTMAAELLKEQGNPALPAIIEVLADYGVKVSVDITLEEGIQALDRLYDQKQFEKAEQIYVDGKRSLDLGECPEAAKIFKQLLDMPAYLSASKLPAIVEAYTCISNYKQPEKLLKGYLSEYPQDVAAKQLLGELYLKQGEYAYKQKDWEGAIRFLRRAELYRQQDDNAVERMLGEVFWAQGQQAKEKERWAQAIISFRQAEKYLPEPAVVQREIASASVRARWWLFAIGITAAIAASLSLILYMEPQFASSPKAGEFLNKSEIILHWILLVMAVMLIVLYSRAPTITTYSILSLSGGILSGLCLTIASGFLLKNLRFIQTLFLVLAVAALLIGGIMLGVALETIGLHLLIGLALGFGIGLFWKSESLLFLTPFIFLGLLILTSPFLWPLFIPNATLGAIVLLASIVFGGYSPFSASPAHAFTYRMFIYSSWLILAVYVIVTFQHNSWITGLELLAGIAILSAGFVGIEHAWGKYFWGMPEVVRWANRWALISSKPLTAKTHRNFTTNLSKMAAFEQDDATSATEMGLWFTGRSIRFHKDVDTLCQDFITQYVLQHDQQCPIMGDPLLTSPSTFSHRSLYLYIEQHLWRELRQRIPEIQRPGFDEKFMYKRWPYYANRLMDAIHARNSDQTWKKYITLLAATGNAGMTTTLSVINRSQHLQMEFEAIDLLGVMLGVCSSPDLKNIIQEKLVECEISGLIREKRAGVIPFGIENTTNRQANTAELRLFNYTRIIRSAEDVASASGVFLRIMVQGPSSAQCHLNAGDSITFPVLPGEYALVVYPRHISMPSLHAEWEIDRQNSIYTVYLESRLSATSEEFS